MDAMLEPTVLQALWFAIIAFFFLGYFVLEGFDFGVQMNVAAFWRRGPAKRGTILQTIGPVWDGNEVWLITGGALLFAAFPEWYATLFSGFYLALLLLLLVLIVRVCAFKWRDKVDNPTWTTVWDVIHEIGRASCRERVSLCAVAGTRKGMSTAGASARRAQLECDSRP